MQVDSQGWQSWHTPGQGTHLHTIDMHFETRMDVSLILTGCLFIDSLIHLDVDRGEKGLSCFFLAYIPWLFLSPLLYL